MKLSSSIPTNPPDCRPIYHVTPIPPEAKYPTGRSLATAFWISFFAMYWLLLLEVLEMTAARAASTFFFLLIASILTLLIAARDNVVEEKNE